MFCALHFHYGKLIAQLKVTPPAIIEEESEGLGQVATEHPAARSDQEARAAAD